MVRYPVNLFYTRRIRMTGVPVGHPNHGVTFQVLQEPTDANPFLYIRNESTGELGIIERERYKEMDS